MLKGRCPDAIGAEGLGVSPSFSIPPRLGDKRGLNLTFSELSIDIKVPKIKLDSIIKGSGRQALPDNYLINT